jgi:DNA-binding XRE family transcriptional regulator
MGRKPKDEEVQVNNRIEELRAAAGISRQDLADAVGVHYQTIGYIERGEYSPSLVLALQIAKVLGTSVEDVFHLDEENKR